MISIENVKKIYFTKNQSIEALKEVNLTVEKGDIFGIIGYSGAGKSTLIRCINLLEKPTEGKVFVDGKELTGLSAKELRKTRKNIGMIFQHFNLMRSRNVFQNIAYPLKGCGLTKEEIKAKVFELLELVRLQDKVFAYPSQLSGGQKQRVAIARALANDPQVLLCDEATSALDPQTTKSILNLLKQINKRLNLTIVIITHEMQVIKEICNKVAVMEDGQIVEQGQILNIFTDPKEEITRDFIATIFRHKENYGLLKENQLIKELDKQYMVANLLFIGEETSDPYISRVSRSFEVDASILFGSIETIGDITVGNLIVRFGGKGESIKKAIAYLEDHHIHVEVIENVNHHRDLDTQSASIIS